MMLESSSALVLAICLCISCRCAVSQIISASTPVRIGGFFAPVSPNLGLFVDQAQHLAAFVMAITDINNKSDGIFDDILPTTELQFAVGTESSLASAATNVVELAGSFGGQGVDAVVSSLSNTNTLVVSQLLNTMNVMTVLTMAYSSMFDQFSTYPYVANIRPLVSRHGMVLQNLFCVIKVKKIVIFAGTDADDIAMMTQFQEESICELNIMGLITVRAEVSDMSYEIEQAKSLGARYYVHFLPPQQNAKLIEQGYESGLFHEHTVILCSAAGTTNITQYFSPETDVARVLTGVFYTRYDPISFVNAPLAVNFTHRWREQPSRAGQMVNNTLVCDTTTDSDGNYVYQVVMNKTTVCTGLDFTSHSASHIRPYTYLTYDATIMVTMAMDLAIRNGLNHNDPTVLMDLMVNNVSFTGVTGPMNLFKGYPEYSYNGRGTRSAGTPYNFYNFNPGLYRNGSDNYWVRIGIFDGNAKTYKRCSPVDNVACFQPVFSGKTGGSYSNRPPDSPATIVSIISPAFSALCFAMAGMIGFLTLVFGLFTLVHRRSKVIKASQPTLLWCILTGGAIAAVRIVIGGIPKNDRVCSEEVWFGHLAFILMVGSLFVKSYRVHCIVNTRKLVRVTFSAMHAFRLLVGIVTAIVVYLAVTQVVGYPHMSHQITVVANQATDVRFCAMKYSQFQTALYFAEALMLIVSFRVCWEIRNVPDVVNESKQISTAMSAIVMVSVLIMPIVYFLGLSHYTQELVASFGFGFGAIVTLVLLFVPKIMVQYHVNSARISAKVAAETIFSSKKKYQGGVPAQEGTNAPQIDHDAEAMLKGKTKEEKLYICQEQMRRWQVLLLVQQRAALNSNSTSSNANGSSEGINSLSPIRIEQSNLSSVVVADPAEFVAMREELFTMDGPVLDVCSSLNGGTISGSMGTMSMPRQNDRDQLVIQDV
jgi:hypothetical protein